MSVGDTQRSETYLYDMVAPYLEGLSWADTPPPESFLAASPDPSAYFNPGHPHNRFTLDYRGTPTRVVLIRDPRFFGPEMETALAPHWGRDTSMGLVLFANREFNTVGGLFLHSLFLDPTHALLSDPASAHLTPLQLKGSTPAFWATFGGTMSFTDIDLRTALQRVADKGTDMGRKAMAIEISLALETLEGRDRDSHPVHLGGMKEVILHPEGTPLEVMKQAINPAWDRDYTPTPIEFAALQTRMAIDPKGHAYTIAASVLRTFGVSHTGSDQNTPFEWAWFMAERAPNQIVGNPHAAEINRGFVPTEATATGIWAGLQVIHQELFNGSLPETHIEGAGGIGSLLIQNHRDHRGVVTVSDIHVEPLLRARAMGAKTVYLNEGNLRAEYFLSPDKAEAELARARAQGIPIRPDLISTLREHPGTGILSNNASTHPITADVADYLAIDSRVRAVFGATNSVFGLHEGSTDYVVWRLQQGGVFADADYVANRMGATGVIARKIGLGTPARFLEHAQMVAETTRLSLEQFRQGIPPLIYWNHRTGITLNGHLTNTTGPYATGGHLMTGNPSAEIPRTLRETLEARPLERGRQMRDARRVREVEHTGSPLEPGRRGRGRGPGRGGRGGSHR